MIGMNFVSFATLLVVSGIVSFVLHYLAKYRLSEGAEGFWGKVLVGWIGGWLGSPVFGYWPVSVMVGSVYLIPALLGSLAAVFGAVLFLKTLNTIAGHYTAVVAAMGGATHEGEAARLHREAA